MKTKCLLRSREVEGCRPGSYRLRCGSTADSGLARVWLPQGEGHALDRAVSESSSAAGAAGRGSNLLASRVRSQRSRAIRWCMQGIETFWNRGLRSEGKTFRQIRGGEFTYRVNAGCVTPDRMNQNILKEPFAQTLELFPFASAMPVRHLQGPSYVFADLMDPVSARATGNHAGRRSVRRS
jgi:hypothetical protein